jgi:Tfp pilus assembly protein PilF
LERFHHVQAREAAAHAKEAIVKALALDPSNSDAHAENALFAYTDDWDWLRAEREFRLALAQGSHAQAHNLYGWSLMTRGRFDEARSHLRIAAELDPQSSGPALNQAMNSMMNHDLPAAERQLDAILTSDPRSFSGLFLRTAVAIYKNDCPAAYSYFGKISGLYPASSTPPLSTPAAVTRNRPAPSWRNLRTAPNPATRPPACA